MVNIPLQGNLDDLPQHAPVCFPLFESSLFTSSFQLLCFSAFEAWTLTMSTLFYWTYQVQNSVMFVSTVIYWLSTRVILSSLPFTSLIVHLFPTQITCVKARHSLTLSLPLKFHLFISRIYNLCLLARIPVGVYMAVRAQRTQFELCKRKRPHLYYFVERRSQNLFSVKEAESRMLS